MVASRPVLTALRLAAFAAACTRLVLSDCRSAPSWALGLEPAIVGAVLAALAIALEPRPWVRRVMFATLVIVNALRMLHDDGMWRDDPFWTEKVIWTAVESVAILGFIETRLWRWWPIPFFPLTAWFLFHLIPGQHPAVIVERAAWLLQAWLLLVAVVSFRTLARYRSDKAVEQLGAIGEDAAD